MRNSTRRTTRSRARSFRATSPVAFWSSFAVLALLTAILAWLLLAPQRGTLSGSIRHLDADLLTVATDEGRVESFRLAPETIFPPDLERSDRVIVHFRRQGEGRTAIRVSPERGDAGNARRPEPGPPREEPR